MVAHRCLIQMLFIKINHSVQESVQSALNRVKIIKWSYFTYRPLCRTWHLSDRSLDLSSSEARAFCKNPCPALGPAPIYSFIRVLDMDNLVRCWKKGFKQESERIFYHFTLIRVWGIRWILLILVSVTVLHWNIQNKDLTFIWINRFKGTVRSKVKSCMTACMTQL